MQRLLISEIKPYPQNARLHSDEQVELIADSIRKFGFTTPLLIDEGGVLIYGHGRWLAAKKLGLEELPVCIAFDWSEEEKAAYRIMDNQLALRSEWDVPMLQAELQELSIAEYDLSSLGFQDKELKEFIGAGGADNNLTAESKLQGLKFAIIVECLSEEDQAVKLQQFTEMGLACRALIS